jgi:hypothetical protein
MLTGKWVVAFFGGGEKNEELFNDIFNIVGVVRSGRNYSGGRAVRSDIDS